MIFEVSDNFYFSSFPNVEEILTKKITAIICVSKKRTGEDVLGLIKNENWKYLHIIDGRTIQEELFYESVNWVLGKLKERHNVLVHCYGGKNRSATVAALTLMKLKNISGKEAFEIIKNMRKATLLILN